VGLTHATSSSESSNNRKAVPSNRKRAQSFLTDNHIERIVAAYSDFADVAGLARVATLDEIRTKEGNLSIPLYVAPAPTVEHERAMYQVGQAGGLEVALTNWLESSRRVRAVLNDLLASDIGHGNKGR